jgi:hypothetical protein
MPETQPSTKESASLENGEVDSKWLSAYIRFLQDWRISTALVTVFLAQFRQNTLEILLPYASVRFDMELGKVRPNLLKWSMRI